MASNHTSTEVVDVELLAVPARWLAVGVDFAQHWNDRESRRSHIILVIGVYRVARCWESFLRFAVEAMRMHRISWEGWDGS